MTSDFVKCISPVSSRTWIPSQANRLPSFSVTSAARAFIGATYTILKSSVRTTKSVASGSSSGLGEMFFATVFNIVSMAASVLPAPVGAQISMFSLL